MTKKVKIKHPKELHDSFIVPDQEIRQWWKKEEKEITSEHMQLNGA